MSGLRRSERHALLQHCEPVELVFGQILCEPGEAFEHAHFPLSGFVSQLAISAACTHFHETAPRLARWLLMTHDRAHADHFHLTHAFLADMLGVRRSSISVAAAAMQRDRLIVYSRGDITILDRRRLELAACRCYAAETADYTRLFGATRRRRA